MLNVLRNKGLWAVAVSLLLVGAAFAGAKCDHDKAKAAGMGAHCNLAKKSVVKDAKMTEDGAIVTLKGKNAEAISHIKEHLAAHANGESCPDCPLSMEGVTTTVEMTDTGGTFTVSGNSPETVKAIQEWAGKPVGACCKHSEPTEKG